jgi:hypothetical protein
LKERGISSELGPDLVRRGEKNVKWRRIEDRARIFKLVRSFGIDSKE